MGTWVRVDIGLVHPIPKFRKHDKKRIGHRQANEKKNNWTHSMISINNIKLYERLQT